MRRLHSGIALLSVLLLTGCASLAGLGIQAPRFSAAPGQSAELRLAGPSLANPLGGATIRIYTRVENPNPIGITLASLAGTLQLEGFNAAEANFPLGLPMRAGEATVVPLDLTVSFANLPGLADVLTRSLTRGEIAYSLRGTASVDAGVLGQPSFGPMTLVQGTVQARR